MNLGIICIFNLISDFRLMLYRLFDANNAIFQKQTWEDIAVQL